MKEISHIPPEPENFAKHKYKEASSADVQQKHRCARSWEREEGVGTNHKSKTEGSASKRLKVKTPLSTYHMADTELGGEAVEVLAGSLVGRLCPLHPAFAGKASGVCSRGLY